MLTSFHSMGASPITFRFFRLSLKGRRWYSILMPKLAVNFFQANQMHHTISMLLPYTVIVSWKERQQHPFINFDPVGEGGLKVNRSKPNLHSENSNTLLVLLCYLNLDVRLQKKLRKLEYRIISWSQQNFSETLSRKKCEHPPLAIA